MIKNSEVLKFEDTDFCNTEVLERSSYSTRRATIVAELGEDRTVTPVDIQKMIEAGLNVAKIRGTHITKEERIHLLGKVDKAASYCSKKFGITAYPVASCITLRTYIMRTGLLLEDVEYIMLEDNDDVKLTCDVKHYNNCTQSLIFVDNSHLTIDCKVGMEIVMNEGQIVLTCLDIVDDKTIRCIVQMGGKLKHMSLVSIRGMVHSRPNVTNKDLEILKFCLEYQVDMIIIHYVRNIETLLKVKKIMRLMSKTIKRPVIISAICTQLGLDNIDDLLKESDGLLLAREFIQFEVAKQYQFRLPLIQKYVAAKCRQAGKPMFISGGVLQGLVVNAERKDSEVTDITNALLDGVTGFVLTRCRDVDNTILAIHKLNDLCRAIEPLTFNKSDIRLMKYESRMPMTAADAAVISCAFVAQMTQARLIIVPTVTGSTARALQHMRPNCIVITVSTKISVTRLLSMYRCIVPLVYNGPNHRLWHKTVERRVDFALQYALKQGWIALHEYYVTLERYSDTSGYSNMIRIWTMEIVTKFLVECPSDEDEKVNRNASIYSKSSQ